MWPFDRIGRGPDNEVLRIGRIAAERWARSSAGLTVTASAALPTGRSLKPSDLAPAIAELYRDKPSAGISLVLESAWLPIMLVDTGTSVLSTRQIQMLVRHRLGPHVQLRAPSGQRSYDVDRVGDLFGLPIQPGQD